MDWGGVEDGFGWAHFTYRRGKLDINSVEWKISSDAAVGIKIPHVVSNLTDLYAQFWNFFSIFTLRFIPH